ncbi:MAG: Maf family nucleotide pyrophosphatase [Betaproteobacteria bacterium]|nr:Maf family nucleotide pyrophosphatase [Betaproteobacteria bacterium]
MPELVLASTSVYRRELLSRLQIPFVVASPDVDEAPRPGEPPAATALRLSEAKARAVKDRFPHALIIGSDQVADLDGEAIGKPISRENAIRQLTRMQGKGVSFHTGLCVYNSLSDRAQCELVPYRVRFRPLTQAQIERYLAKEQPYNCAGSARTEGLGISLLEAMTGDDPTALIGLPLITLVRLLNNEGLDLP